LFSAEGKPVDAENGGKDGCAAAGENGTARNLRVDVAEGDADAPVAPAPDTTIGPDWVVGCVAELGAGWWPNWKLGSAAEAEAGALPNILCGSAAPKAGSVAPEAAANLV